MITVSDMTINDCELISNKLLSDFDDFWSVNVFKSDYQNSLSHYIVAKLDNAIVGFAGLIDTLDQFEITNIVVKKGFRKQGIGNILLKSLISIARKNNKDKIFLEVNATNLAALKLYEKNGFKKCGLRKKYYKNKDDAILMTLIID